MVYGTRFLGGGFLAALTLACGIPTMESVEQTQLTRGCEQGSAQLVAQFCDPISLRRIADAHRPSGYDERADQLRETCTHYPKAKPALDRLEECRVKVHAAEQEQRATTSIRHRHTNMFFALEEK